MNGSRSVRDDDINFGDRTKLAGPASKSLAIVNLPSSRPLTIYADVVSIKGTPAAVAGVVPLATIEWGSGTAMVKAEYRIVGRLRVPLVGSSVKVDGRLVDAKGQAPPDDVTMEIAAFIACGIDGETIPNARAVVQSGASGVLSERSERVLAVEGHNGASSAVWIMLFEGANAPTAGDVPRMATPAAANGAFRMRPRSPREFVGGVRWAVSGTPITFTPAPGAAVFIEAEILP